MASVTFTTSIDLLAQAVPVLLVQANILQWRRQMMRLFRLWRLCAQDLQLMWLALRHPSRPIWLLPAAALVGLYALDPLNVAIPVLGFIDELVLVPLILHGLVMLLPAGIRRDCESSIAARRRAAHF